MIEELIVDILRLSNINLRPKINQRLLLSENWEGVARVKVTHIPLLIFTLSLEFWGIIEWLFQFKLEAGEIFLEIV